MASSSSVPRLPLIPAPGGATSSTTSARGTGRTAASGNGVLVSSSRTKYVPADAGSSAADAESRILSPRDLRQITKYIHANRSLKPQHRAGRLSDIIPAAPFQRLDGQPADSVLGLRLARINPAESALDIPLRLAVPADYHVPTINDLSMQSGVASSLSTRILALLKATSHVPQHSPEEREGTQRDVAHCNVIRDWEMRANVARRAGQERPRAVALLALGSLHYRAANREKAIRYFSDGAVAFEQAADARGAALCHNLIGVCHMHLGRHEEALLHHRKQGAISGEYGRAVAQLNIGVCYGGLGNSEAAAQVLEDALRSAVAAEDDVLVAIAKGNLGIAAMRLGDLRSAQQHVEGCLEHCSVAGDQVGAGVCLLLLADMYNQLGDFAHAQFYGEHALRVATEARCTDVADVARVSIGVARGAQSAQAAVMGAARGMGTGVSVDQVIATLPRQ